MRGGTAVTFTLPTTPGTYNVRFFLNDTSTEAGNERDHHGDGADGTDVD